MTGPHLSLAQIRNRLILTARAVLRQHRPGPDDRCPICRTPHCAVATAARNVLNAVEEVQRQQPHRPQPTRTAPSRPDDLARHPIRPARRPVVDQVGRGMMKSVDSSLDDLPKIGAPATRALNDAGYTALRDLAGVPRAELAKLHGMGPKALEIIQSALDQHNLGLGQ